jgi:hypothetical protein
VLRLKRSTWILLVGSLAAVAVLIVGSINAHHRFQESEAHTWVVVDSTSTARAEINTKSIIAEQGDVRSASMRITYTADAVERHFNKQVGAHAGDQVLVEMDYNCTGRGSRDLNLVERDHPYGFIAYNGITTGPAFHAVAPATFDEAALNYVCQYELPFWRR